MYLLFFDKQIISNKILNTISSMDINEAKNIQFVNKNGSKSSNFNIIDIPGIGYFKDTLMTNISSSKIIIVFIDSSDKNSLHDASEFIYNIINSEDFDEESNMIIACNKSDLKFSKSKSIIENELNSEVDAKKLIKQKTNLDEENNQLGKLYVSFLYYILLLYSLLKLNSILKCIIMLVLLNVKKTINLKI